MEAKVFEAFRDLIYERSGITLRDGKESLVQARVGKRMRALGLDDHRQYLELVTGDESGEEVVQLLDAISTNVTKFFREPEHFEFLARVVGEWLRAGQRRFRFWSAASSTGEEPYTMAMTLLETPGAAGTDMKLLATDISTRVLEKAQAGEYGIDKLGEVPGRMLDRWFTRMRDGEGNRYRVKDELRRMIVFRRMNLSTPPFPMQGPLDVIFCRNVMIYFDNDVRRRLLADMYRLLKPGGYLMVGHAESLTGMVSEFRTVVPSIYVKGMA
ncbi:MAG TPA: protein-glutamate O-methyltransferase CheR [Planctomycetota bacterium]|nr:protein-glutamate O-methyltransferase CheR [Planctomycetota bacterium]